ncbi:MAG: response regulator transcription factor [Anaerolineae bacterium]|nr:response regulator transcription factor [Anaerolineae bacterium]
MERRILIVEDNTGWQEELKYLCGNVLDAIHADETLKDLYLDALMAYNKETAIHVVGDLESAKAYIEQEAKTRPSSAAPPAHSYFDLVTVDINLTDDTLDSSTEGWDFLTFLKEKLGEANVVVVSGEKSPGLVIEGLQKYGAMSYVWKSQFEDSAFEREVKAIVLYNDAIKLLDTWQWHNAKRALTLWKMLRQIEFDNPPVYRLNADDIFAKRVDSVTHIPNANWSHKMLGLLLDQSNWALMSLTIKGLEDFSSVLRGSQHADQVRRFMAQILESTLLELGNETDFAGHVDGQFIVISTPDRIETLWQNIEEKFTRQIGIFYDLQDNERGYAVLNVEGREQKIPLMRVVRSQVTAADGPFFSIETITELAAERKQNSNNKSHI